MSSRYYYVFRILMHWWILAELVHMVNTFQQLSKPTTWPLSTAKKKTEKCWNINTRIVTTAKHNLYMQERGFRVESLTYPYVIRLPDLVDAIIHHLHQNPRPDGQVLRAPGIRHISRLSRYKLKGSKSPFLFQNHGLYYKNQPRVPKFP